MTYVGVGIAHRIRGTGMPIEQGRQAHAYADLHYLSRSIAKISSFLIRIACARRYFYVRCCQRCFIL